MKKKLSLAAFSAAALVTLAAPAHAHATLETGEAKLGSSYKAVVRVPHGCAGKATLKVRVKIPEGVIGVKPQPKAGWQLETVTTKYAQSYKLHGNDIGEGVTEIVWTGNLPDAWYDEFAFRGTLAETLGAGNTVYIPVVQECEGGGAERWIEIPAAGQDPHEMKKPAPGLKLLPKG